MLSLSLITVLLLLAASSQGATSTNVWLMKLAPGAKPTQVAHKLGLTYLHAMPGGVYHAFEVSPHASLHEVAAHMDNDPLVEWHEHQMAHQQTLRGNIDGQTGVDIESAYSSSRHLLSRESGGYITGQTGADGEYIQFGGSRRLLSQEPRDSFVVHDPLYVQQWHLRGTGNSTPVNVAANVAWNMGPSYRGNGYVLAIVDDGINRVHPDLASNYVSGMSYDFNSQDADPMASIGDTHGTAAAGVAAAGANTACGVGVCPDCKIASMRLIAGPSSDYMEAMALDYKSAQIGVYSNSWGPSDTGNIMGGPGSATKVAFEHDATNGRGGLGTIYVWAGGNGATNGDNANYDGYVNSRFTIGVGAVGYDGKRAYYSERGACLMVCAPSNGANGYGITTTYTDNRGAPSCTSSFGGTSSATPLVAGGIAAVLGKYPGLTRRDILGILAKSSFPIDGSDADWTRRNARGVAHNHQYGWGMLNMPAFFAEAATWRPVGTELSCTTGKVAWNRALGDGVGSDNWGADMPTRVCQGASINFVEYVEVTLWTSQTSRGDLSIILTDPSHVESILSEPHGDTNTFPANGWTYGSARHWGQTMHGAWNLRVADARRNGSRGVLQFVQLTIYGHTE